MDAFFDGAVLSLAHRECEQYARVFCGDVFNYMCQIPQFGGDAWISQMKGMQSDIIVFAYILD